jgi:hypothetical protein
MMLTNDTLEIIDFETLIELALAVDYQLDEMSKWKIATEDEAQSFYRLHQMKLKLDEMVLFERIARDKAKQTTE